LARLEFAAPLGCLDNPESKPILTEPRGLKDSIFTNRRYPGAQAIDPYHRRITDRRENALMFPSHEALLNIAPFSQLAMLCDGAATFVDENRSSVGAAASLTKAG
jgi:hypothetical protein